MPKGPGNSKYVKKINRMTVLNLIKQHEVVSRQELAELTGLTPPAITGIIRELMEIGLVKEVGLAKSRGGRRPVKLKFNPEAGYVLGIEVTRFETSVCVADLMNVPAQINKIDLDMTEPETGIPLLINTIKQILDQGTRERKNFLGIGVAFPGLLSVKEGKVKRSINLGLKWKGYRVKKAFESNWNLPVFVENNSNASALAERWFGGAVSYRDLVYINLGEGISAGIIMDDRILHGFQGHAGEIGHIVMVENGPLCNCGNRGCLESMYGVPALLRKVNSELPLIKKDDPLKEAWQTKGKIGIEDVEKCACVEGSYAHELLRQMARHVGLAIADVVNLYNPEAVFLGGKMAKAMGFFMDVIKDTVLTHAFPEIASSTIIELSTLGEKSGVIGACALALKELFKPTSDIVDYIQSNTFQKRR
nr:MAG: serine/threonine protein kinase [Bacillota bacterium]